MYTLNTTKKQVTFTYPRSNGSSFKLTLPVEDFEMDGIDTRDYPDFCDAFICDCLVNGRQATDAELDQLNDDAELVHQCVEDCLY